MPGRRHFDTTKFQGGLSLKVFLIFYLYILNKCKNQFAFKIKPINLTSKQPFLAFLSLPSKLLLNMQYLFE